MKRKPFGPGKTKVLENSPLMNSVVLWRNFRGTSYLSGLEDQFQPFFPGGSSVQLLIEILGMPPGLAVSYEDACRMVQAEAHVQIELGNNDPEVPGSSNHLMHNWVSWISGQGLKIELGADDFEMVPLFPTSAS